MQEVYLLLGSNVGNRAKNLAKATQQIAQRCGEVFVQSHLYETAAWGNTNQQSFYNMSVGIHTDLLPESLLVTVKEIEQEVGRVETIHWGPRIIDIDIILYAQEIVDLPQLKIPHPYMHERRFTLTPLAEVAGSAFHPVFNKTVNELLKECSDDSEVKAINNCKP